MLMREMILRFCHKKITHSKTNRLLLQREEKKRDAMECEVHLRRIQMKYKVENNIC